MEIKIDLDLQSIITKAVSAERIQPIVDKAVSDAITSAIRDATDYNSEFRKQLKEQLAQAMPHGLGVDDVAKFQHVLNQSINKMVHDSNIAIMQTAIDKAVKATLPDVPTVVKMSELLEGARGNFSKEQHEAFYAYYEPSTSGGGWLYLDGSENPGSRGYGSTHRSREDQKYSAEIQLAFTKEGEVYALRLDGKQITPASRPDIVGHFDAILMAMYVGRTRIEIDMDDDDVQAAASEQYD